jgi:hypothetical protein
MIPVPLFDLKFVKEYAAGSGEASNRRHQSTSRAASKKPPLRSNN